MSAPPPRRVNPLSELTTYLQTLRELPQTPELLSSISAEIVDQECALACDQKGSKQLEFFLPSLPDEVFCKLLDLDVLFDIYGSHVLQHSLTASRLEPTADFVLTHLAEVATTAGAAHVLRRLIQLAAQNAPELFARLSENFQTLLVDTALLRQPLVAATLGALVDAGAAAPAPALLALVARLDVATLLDDAAGSRVVEKSLQLLKGRPEFGAKLAELVKAVGGSNTQALRTRPYVAFVLQETVPFIQTAQEMETLIGNLQIDVADAKQLAIVQRAALRAAEPAGGEERLRMQKLVSRRIRHLFGGKDLWVRNILKLDSREKFPAGALLYSTLLKFDRTEIADAEVAVLADHLDFLLAGKGTMRVLETIFEKFPRVTKTLAERMLGNSDSPWLETLAVDLRNGGSFLVAALWQGLTTEVEVRKQISERLLKIEGFKELNFKLWKICNLGAAQMAPKQWQESLVKQRKAKHLLDNIFDRPTKQARL